jgi:glycosyltransferase involved in cell wall biosynthesis
MADWLQRKSSGDKPQVFAAKGGTEILIDGLKKHTNIEQYDNINLLVSTPNADKLRYTKKNVLWQHLNYADESLAPMRDPAFMKAINSTVYVSHWQLEKFRYLFQVPLNNANVIRNAIEPIEFKPKSKDGKLKLIYTSTPFRGLSILLDVMEILNRDDIELDVYSSTAIYSSGYQAAYGDLYKDLFDKAKSMNNVNYHGYADNKDIHKALQEAHILTYPSIFEETACLAMIEAGAAGCSLVTTDLGALPETGSMYSKMMTTKSDEMDIKISYAQHLNQAINDYWDKSNQELLKEQSDFYNKFYSWDVRARQWNEFFEKVSQGS